MKAVSILHVDMSDLQHGLEVICTTEGTERQGAIAVMLADLAALPECSALGAFAAELMRVQMGDSPVRLPLLFADLAVAFSGWSAAAFIDQKQKQERVEKGRRGGVVADMQKHEARVAAVARLMQQNKSVSKERACELVGVKEGVTTAAIKQSLRKIEKESHPDGGKEIR
jgi:hypothetical protein